jgi:hypothetical protein
MGDAGRRRRRKKKEAGRRKKPQEMGFCKQMLDAVTWRSRRGRRGRRKNPMKRVS